jgi:predicted kinase
MDQEKVWSKMSFKVVNIRGVNGSGKSWLVRRLMKDYGAKAVRKAERTDLLGIGTTVEGYRVNYKGAPFYVLGPYHGAKSGGCDLVKTQDEVCDLVRKYIKLGHVVFEGVIVSTLYRKRYYPLSKELGGFIWTYLDTPLEICLDRIKKRDGKVFDEFTYKSERIKGKIDRETEEQAIARWRKGIYRSENTLLEGKYKSTMNSRQRALDDGENVVDLHHRNALLEFYQLLDTLV